MTTNYIHDVSEQPVITRLSNESRPFHHDKVETGWHSGLTTGKFVGLNTTGNLVEADARSSVNVPAIGALVINARQSWTLASKSGNKDYVEMDAYEEYVTFKVAGLDDFTIGQPIFLSSGGGITQNYPWATDEISQQVAWAVSADEYAVRIGPAYRHGWGP